MRAVPCALMLLALPLAAGASGAYERDGTLWGSFALGSFDHYQFYAPQGSHVTIAIAWNAQPGQVEALARPYAPRCADGDLLCAGSPVVNHAQGHVYPAGCGALASGPLATSPIVFDYVADRTGDQFVNVNALATTAATQSMSGGIPYHITIAVDGADPDVMYADAAGFASWAPACTVASVPDHV